jgi:hypothetical protein
MGFLDNLENNLKALEGREEGGAGGEQERQRREQERREAIAAQPHAEKLRSGPFTDELLREAAAAGHAARTKIHVAWIGTTLRLEARSRRLELRPAADGIIAVFLENNAEVRRMPVDLGSGAASLVRELLAK